MRLLISLTVVVLLAVILLTGCNSNELTASKNRSAPCTPSSPGGEPRRITPAELKNELASGGALLIDVRGESAYKTAHIKGSRQIPFAEIANHSDELPRDRLIVTYCS